MILNLVKKFPITCYGVVSFFSYLLADSLTVYDHPVIVLTIFFLTYPAMWVIISTEKLLLQEFLLRSASGKSSLEDLIIEFCLVIFVTILLDLLLLSIRTGSLKNFLKKTYHKLTKPKK